MEHDLWQARVRSPALPKSSRRGTLILIDLGDALLAILGSTFGDLDTTDDLKVQYADIDCV